MRVLFLSSSNPFPIQGIGGYCGGGWISSLIKLVDNVDGIDVGVAYATDVHEQPRSFDGIKLLPVYISPLSVRQKLRLYYGGYKHQNYDDYIKGAEQAIESFKPDIVHLFGIENQFASIISHTSVPVLCHLQGLLSPIANAYYPSGMNRTSLLWPFSIREWVIRNGYIFANKCLRANGEVEKKIFKHLHYAMGRTEWDYEVSQLLAPKSKYFHVDEVLRPTFYDNAGKWTIDNCRKFTIVSTLSETIYKGLDLVLKTSKLLKDVTGLDFEWNIIGIDGNSNFVKFFERNYGIKSHEVNINYLGVKQPDDIIRILLDASVYVHTSYIDNSPNSICEAQMIGCPVIATNVGGVSSLVKDNDTGILVPANAPFELAYKLKTLSNNTALCTKLSNNSKGVAATRHDKQIIVEQLIETYNKILKR